MRGLLARFVFFLVLLAPLTARLLADSVEGAPPDPAVDPRRLLPPREGAPTCA